MTFPDHFSPVAAQYAASRPGYPDELFALLGRLAPARRLAWDAGCGSGQASVGLAAHFTRVIATDASAAQIANAEPRDNITYAVSAECNAALESDSVDLITVAQALHWFDRDEFYAEADRVLAPDGVLAVWTYGHASITPDVDGIVRTWYDDVIGPYWPPERAHPESGYRNIGYPYPVIDVPAIEMRMHWSRDQFVAYLATWSAVKEYRRHRGADPMAEILPALHSAWPGDVPRVIRWPLTLLAGRRQR